jgi:DNA-binding PadR family transcriptional regulator
VIPLDYALLGLLARAPLSGYDILREMEEPIGFFWHARRSQIYPQLARLEAAGLITHTVVEQRDRPDKKVYAVTDAGRAALRRWAATPALLPADRDELMLKVYSLWLATPPEALALLRAYERAHLDQLARYEAIAADLRTRWDGPPRFGTQQFTAYATLTRGIEYERGYADWCRHLTEEIERQLAEGAVPDADPAGS